ncbi:protein crumbs homolog 3 isoform X1 [Ictidomys tridecemlineatus]
MATPALGLLLALGLPLLPALLGRAWGQATTALNTSSGNGTTPPSTPSPRGLVGHTCPLPLPEVSGGHYCYHRGFLHPGCLAPGRGAGATGTETSGEAADRGHLPAQQRGAVLSRSGGPSPPGLQGEGHCLPSLMALPCTAVGSAFLSGHSWPMEKPRGVRPMGDWTLGI